MTPQGNLSGMGSNSPNGGNLYNTISSAASSPNSQNSSQAPEQSSPAEQSLQVAAQATNAMKQVFDTFPGIAEEEKSLLVQAMGRYFEKVVSRMSQGNSANAQSGQMQNSGMGGGESGY